ncbi:MAG: hypothetical protein WCT08_05460 [Patescibacteria group bacterium]|jgi:hypothetical protein
MASWVKFIFILVIAMGMILIVANTQNWPVALLLPGSIIGLLAALFGISDNSISSRRESGFHFLAVSLAVLFTVFLIDQTVTYGFRAMMAGVLTGDGPLATNSELIICWSLIAEITLCVLMIRYIPSHMASDTKPSYDGLA